MNLFESVVCSESPSDTFVLSKLPKGVSDLSLPVFRVAVRGRCVCDCASTSGAKGCISARPASCSFDESMCSASWGCCRLAGTFSLSASTSEIVALFFFYWIGWILCWTCRRDVFCVNACSVSIGLFLRVGLSLLRGRKKRLYHELNYDNYKYSFFTCDKLGTRCGWCMKWLLFS